MPTLLIENLDEALHRDLTESAAAHHRSLADEARELLRAAVKVRRGPREHLVDAAERLFGPEHGIDLDIPPRGSAPSRPSPDFSDID